MGQICKVKADGAKLYAAPTMKSAVIASLSKDATVTKLGEAILPPKKPGGKEQKFPGWWRVSTTGNTPQEGYVFTKRLAPLAPPIMFGIDYLMDLMKSLSRVQSFANISPQKAAFQINSALLPDFNAVLTEYGINQNALRFAHFMAQIAHESGHFTKLGESLNYTPKTEEAFVKIFANRFGPYDTAEQKLSAKATARAFLKDLIAREKRGEITNLQKQEMIGNRVYAKRNGNGDEASGDGYRYRGRGFIQLTGRKNYREISDEMKIPGVDLEKEPDILLTNPVIALKASAAYWKLKGLNELADLDDVNGITSVINGGLTGIEDRVQLLAKAKKIWTPDMGNTAIAVA